MAKANSKKKSITRGYLVGAVLLLTLGGLLFIATIVFGILTFFYESTEFLFGAISCFVFTCFCIPFGAVQLKRYIKIKKNADNPDSLCAKTYGGGKNYIRIPVYLDREEQKERNMWVSLLGIFTFIGLGFGFFSFGAQSWDAFISEDEILINSKQKNKNLDDRGFHRYPATEIKQILLGGIEQYTKVTFVLHEGANVILEVLVRNKKDYAHIQEVFQLLLPDDENTSVPDVSTEL